MTEAVESTRAISKTSVSGRSWERVSINESYAQELRGRLGISDLLARLLSLRADNLHAASDFLSPKISNLLPDPYTLLDMEKAVERTISAIDNGEKICIFADYDVDGATSSALLKNIFRDLGIDVEIYVPDRILEGYGPSKEAMEKLKAMAIELVITVDCGSVSYEPLSHAKDIGLDVIVIDHHIGGEILPEAVAVINPNRLDEKSEYTYLAAVGVSFLFAVALVSKLQKNVFFQDKSKPNLLKYLDLVALGSVCDVMQIVGLNRAFVAQGLKVMGQRQNIGLNALCDISELKEAPDCYHLGFILGPRVNAGGRVGLPHLGAHLLSATSESVASEIAILLDQHNIERKAIESAMLEEAMALAHQQADNNLLFIIGEGWHVGVIGIIAGRLKEKFNKPVAVVAVNDGIGKASCRSVHGVNFGAKLINAKGKGLIIVGGGHAMAAGFTATNEQLKPLSEFLNKEMEAEFLEYQKERISYYSMDLTSSSINLDLMNEINKLAPFGNGNHEPIFKISKLFVLKADIVGQKHISCLLAPSKEGYGNKPIRAIAFNAVGTEIQTCLLNKYPYTIDVIGTLKQQTWQGRVSIQLQIKDIVCCEK